MKHQLMLRVEFVRHLKGGSIHLGLAPTDGSTLPHMAPGQFVEVAVDKAPVLLNRPFSIFNYTPSLLELMVKPLGRASEALGLYQAGDILRVIAPLGRGFSQPSSPAKVLLVGGGVGIAPLYYQARALNELGIRPTVVYGERTAPDANLRAMFEAVSDLHICTDDGSEGFHGFVINHPAVVDGEYDLMQVCGPLRMMQNMYKVYQSKGMNAEFSLENKMACGLGACLCCVEKTTTGHKCVCSDGPVFNANELPW